MDSQLIPKLVHRALVLAAQAHHWHLATKSYAQHMALGELYGYMHDAADALAEKAMGADMPFPDRATVSGFAFTPPTAAVKTVEAYVKELDAVTEPPWLANTAQEIQGRLNGILYKLKRLS